MSFFFLKINEDAFYSIPCLQKWLEIVEASGYQFKIVCDNSTLSKKILQGRVKYKGRNLTDSDIIKSYKESLAPLLEPLLSKNWLPAGVAHLTTFAYAREHGLKSFWNIDADDTSFFSSPNVIWSKMKRLEMYADDANISCASFDMWNTLTNDKHWSFGITYTRCNVDYFDFITNKENTNWKETYIRLPKYMYNLDWFFTWIRDYKNCNMTTFYFESEFFIHWKMPFNGTVYNNVHFYNNKVLVMPSHDHLFGSTCHQISPKSICIYDSSIEQIDTTTSRERLDTNISRLINILQILRCEIMAVIHTSKRGHYLSKSAHHLEKLR